MPTITILLLILLHPNTCLLYYQVYLARSSAAPATIKWQFCFDPARTRPVLDPQSTRTRPALDPYSTHDTASQLAALLTASSLSPPVSPGTTTPTAPASATSATLTTTPTVASLRLRLGHQTFHASASIRLTLVLYSESDGEEHKEESYGGRGGSEMQEVRRIDVVICAQRPVFALEELPAKIRAVTIEASLQGGEGDSAWQHTQLFRQGTEKPENHFDVQFRLTTE
jgi:hypothetical protein